MESTRQKVIYGLTAAVAVIGIIYWLSGDGDPADDLAGGKREVRLDAIGELEQRNDEQAVTTISKYLQDDDVYVARRSLQALGRMRDHDTTSKITAALADKREEVREAAVVALASRTDDPNSLKELRRRLTDQREAPHVRAAAAAALGGAWDTEALPLLVRAMEDKDETVRREAAGAAEKLLDREFTESQYLPDDDFPAAKRRAFVQELMRFANSEFVRSAIKSHAAKQKELYNR